MLDRKADCGLGPGSGFGWWTPERKNMVMSLPVKAGIQVARAWDAQANSEQPGMWLPLLELLCRVSWKALATTLWLKIRGPLQPLESFWDQNFALEDARARYAKYHTELKESLEQKARLLGGPGRQWAKGLAESAHPDEVVYPGGQVGAPAPEAKSRLRLGKSLDPVAPGHLYPLPADQGMEELVQSFEEPGCSAGFSGNNPPELKLISESPVFFMTSKDPGSFGSELQIDIMLSTRVNMDRMFFILAREPDVFLGLDMMGHEKKNYVSKFKENPWQHLNSFKLRFQYNLKRCQEGMYNVVSGMKRGAAKRKALKVIIAVVNLRLD